jgi:hypothetical protein
MLALSRRRGRVLDRAEGRVPTPLMDDIGEPVSIIVTGVPRTGRDD